MATKNPSESGKGKVLTITWGPFTSADSAASYFIGDFEALTVQFLGTFDSATAVFAGSMDDTNYSTLSNQAGTAISHTSAVVKCVAEHAAYIKPTFSGGGGSQSITVVANVTRRKK